MENDFYSTLGISREASSDDIKKAFRKLAHEHHPDKGGSDVQFKKINEAYQTLSDPDKRKRYDQFGSSDGFQGFEGFSGQNQNIHFDFGNFTDLGDIFSDMFGFGGGGKRQSQNRKTKRGGDIQVNIDITLVDVLTGLKKSLEISHDAPCPICAGTGAKDKKLKTCATCAGSGIITQRHQSFFGTIENRLTCSTCKGSGKIPEHNCTSCHGTGLEHQRKNIEVAIPAGIDNNQTIRYGGLGNAVLGGEPGDLLITIGIVPDRRFNRDGINLKTEKNISLPVMMLGGETTIETLTGPLTLKIPSQTASGTIFRLKEQGLPRLNSKSRGDLYVLAKLIWPKKITNKIKKVISDVADDLMNDGEKL